MNSIARIAFPSLCVLSPQVAAQVSHGPPATASDGLQSTCAQGVVDLFAPTDCIPAASLPTLGALLPIGPYFFVSPMGEVGIGTTAPTAALEVRGDVVLGSRLASGNRATLGLYQGIYDGIWDFSHEITDFSSAIAWDPFRSYVTLAPQVDLTGATGADIYSHELVVQTAAGNPHDFQYVQGPYIWALHNGTGSIDSMIGDFVIAENNHGEVKFQVGASMASLGDWESTTSWNAAAFVWAGHVGPYGAIDKNHGLYVLAPLTESPLANNYGIFVEDQDAAQQDNYGIYVEGGQCYFADPVGIGTDTPGAELEVVGDFVASGTKSFVEPHPSDPSKEIRFVCLEGNEAGTYFRGNGKLVGGRAHIAVPEEFGLVTETGGLSVQVTPIGGPSVLWVESIDLQTLSVRGDRDVHFSYMVNGVRHGYSDYQVIRERSQAESNASKRPREATRQHMRQWIERTNDGR